MRKTFMDDQFDEWEAYVSGGQPGGSLAAAHLHHARAGCRRVEIGVLQLAAREPVNPNVAIYLNRLSDLLFVLARLANDRGESDVLWKPGQSTT